MAGQERLSGFFNSCDDLGGISIQIVVAALFGLPIMDRGSCQLSFSGTSCLGQ
jgi:hypothetical protein